MAPLFIFGMLGTPLSALFRRVPKLTSRVGASLHPLVTVVGPHVIDLGWFTSAIVSSIAMRLLISRSELWLLAVTE